MAVSHSRNKYPFSLCNEHFLGNPVCTHRISSFYNVRPACVRSHPPPAPPPPNQPISPPPPRISSLTTRGGVWWRCRCRCSCPCSESRIFIVPRARYMYMRRIPCHYLYHLVPPITNLISEPYNLQPGTQCECIPASQPGSHLA